MAVTPARVLLLRPFGLSEYQARVYLALLELGTVPAREAARLAKVPVGKVYHALDQLARRGLVRVRPESPRRYEPVPFAEYLGRVRAEHEQKIVDVDAASGDLARELAVTGAAAVSDRGNVTVGRGRVTALDAMAVLCRGATRTLVISASKGMVAGQQAAAMTRHADDARARGVDVRVHASSGRAGAARGLPGDVGIVVADDERAAFTHFVPDDGDLRAGSDMSLTTDYAALVGALLASLPPGRPAAHAVSAPLLAWRADARAAGAGEALAHVSDVGVVDLLADDDATATERGVLADVLRRRLRPTGRAVTIAATRDPPTR